MTRMYTFTTDRMRARTNELWMCGCSETRSAFDGYWLNEKQVPTSAFAMEFVVISLITQRSYVRTLPPLATALRERLK